MQYQLINHSILPMCRHYLRSLYVLGNGSLAHQYVCVPNGEIGISIILNGETHMKIENEWVLQPQISIYGLVHEVQTHRMSPHYREVNLGFSPHFLQLFIKDSMSALLKRKGTDLFDLMDKSTVQQLQEQVILANTEGRLLHSIEWFLKRQIQHEKPDSRISEAHRLMMEQEYYRVEDVSEKLGITSTTLRNLFREKVGISPKDLIKISRIKRALKTENPTEESLTQLAYGLGFYDQAHFIHDFKSAIGLTPGAYFSNQNLTFDFYNFQRWQASSFDV